MTVSLKALKPSADFDNAGIGPRTLVISDAYPEGQRSNALGGNAYGHAALEVSFPLVASLLGSVFVEAGTVGLLDDEFKILSGANQIVRDDLSIRAVFGASVFWDSPFGPIRFDFTKPIAKEDFDETKSFQFNTSTRF